LAVIQEFHNPSFIDAALQVMRSWATSLWLLNPYMGIYPLLDGPAWAMSVFIPGYAIDAWGGAWISRLRSRTLAVTIVVLLLLSAGVFFLAVSIQGFDGLGYPPRKYTALETFLHIFPPLRILEIIAGILLGLFVHRKYYEIERLVQKMGGSDFVQSAILLLLSIGLVLGCQANQSFAFFATHGLLAIPLVGFIIACSMNNGFLSAMGSTKLGKQLPKLSIAIYLLHWPLFAYYDKLFTKYTGVNASMSIIGIVIFFVTLFSLGYYIDKVLQRVMASIARRTMKIDLAE
jgi:peptidoglycan/LPS O-acetylase OafA/YrhL